MIKEFKEFIARGNVIDLAIAVIIGAAFGAVVTSLVEDIIMPPLGMLLGNVDFSNLFINLSSTPVASVTDAKAKGLATINYGTFINVVIRFVIIALAIFLLLKALKKARIIAPPPAQKRDCPHCFSEISMKATRCPECTSEVAPGTAVAAS